MEIKYTKHFLNKLEDLFAETEYFLRYEKGNFKSGWCFLNEKKVIVVNKYFDVEGKINILLDILNVLEVKTERLSEKNAVLYKALMRRGGQVEMTI
jgi:hypothetical protein